jgi:hypothetical protein
VLRGPQDGKPCPDSGSHDRRSPRPDDQRRHSVSAAAVLDEFFARPDAMPHELVWAFHDVDVSIHPNEHISEAFGSLAAHALLRRRGGVLDAHGAHLARQHPTRDRYLIAACIANHLLKGHPNAPNLLPEHQTVLLNRYLAVLHREDWSSMGSATSGWRRWNCRADSSMRFGLQPDSIIRV